MMTRHVIGLLLILQAAALGHLLWQIDQGPTGQPVAIGGQVTEMHLTPTSTWGGAYGTMEGTQTTLSITAAGVTRTDIAYHDPDNNCSKTEIVAGSDTVDPSTVGPIEPYFADQQLGLQSDKPYSAVQMFNELHRFELAGNSVRLWSLRTRGKLGDYIQGIGQSGGEIVFVTTTKRNAQSYNGEPANYQLLLPTGIWTVNADLTDSCTVLDQYNVTEQASATTRLDLASPERLCTGRENELYSVNVESRRFCTPDEIGRWFCEEAPAIDAQVYHENALVMEALTNESGGMTLTPETDGRYEIRLSDGEQNVRRSIRAAACGEHGNVLYEGDRMIQFPGVNIPRAPESTDPRTEAPGAVTSSITAEYVLITLLTIAILSLGSIGYWRQHKDDSVSLLKARIWLLEHLNR